MQLAAILLLALAPGLPAWAQKSAASAPPVTPVTTLLTIREIDREALSGNESGETMELRSDNTVSVRVTNTGAASGGPQDVVTALRPERAVESMLSARSEELARLGDLDSRSPAHMGDTQTIVVEVPRAEGAQKLLVDGFMPPESLPRALRRVLCVYEKVNEDLRLPGISLTVVYPNGREERRTRTWCDEAREQRGCGTQGEARAQGEALLEAHESEQLADDNIDRYLVVDAGGRAELTTRHNYSLKGLRLPIVRRCAALEPPSVEGLKRLLASDALQALPAMPPLHVERTTWRGYTFLVRQGKGVKRVTIDATDAPAGAPAAEALACAMEQIEHALDAERPVAAPCAAK